MRHLPTLCTAVVTGASAMVAPQMAEAQETQELQAQVERMEIKLSGCAKLLEKVARDKCEDDIIQLAAAVTFLSASVDDLLALFKNAENNLTIANIREMRVDFEYLEKVRDLLPRVREGIETGDINTARKFWALMPPFPAKGVVSHESEEIAAQRCEQIKAAILEILGEGDGGFLHQASGIIGSDLLPADLRTNPEWQNAVTGARAKLANRREEIRQFTCRRPRGDRRQ